MVEFHARKVRVDFGDDIAPQLRHFQHVGLVHGGDLVAALDGEIERHASNADDLPLVVDVRIDAPATAVIEGDAARFAEVDAAGEFADDQNVQPGHQFRFQRRRRGQWREQHRRTQIGEEIETGTQTQQALLGPLFHRQIVPLRPANRTEQHSIGPSCCLQGLRRQRRAVGVDGTAAHIGAVELEGNIQGAENALHVGHDLGTDAVARNCQYAVNHESFVEPSFSSL